VVSKKLNQHITHSYSRWSDYAAYHAKLAGIPDESGDILNEVLLSLIQKDPKRLHALLSRKKGPYTEFDFFVLRMIKLNAHSKTSPYRHKTRNVPLDQNVDPCTIDTEDVPIEEVDPNEVILQKSGRAREVLDSLDIPKIDKKIFSWRFFGDNSLRSWPGQESYSAVCSTYNRVKRKMVAKIRNPHSARKRWTESEISYLKAEYPNMETMSIAHYLGRNHESVKQKAKRLGLKKVPFTNRKIRGKVGKKTFCKSVMKGKVS